MFWDRLVPGAPVLLDDYGWPVDALERKQLDGSASFRGIRIGNLPTGKGLLRSPERATA